MKRAATFSAALTDEIVAVEDFSSPEIIFFAVLVHLALAFSGVPVLPARVCAAALPAWISLHGRAPLRIFGKEFHCRCVVLLPALALGELFYSGPKVRQPFVAVVSFCNGGAPSLNLSGVLKLPTCRGCDFRSRFCTGRAKHSAEIFSTTLATSAALGAKAFKVRFAIRTKWSWKRRLHSFYGRDFCCSCCRVGPLKTRRAACAPCAGRQNCFTAIGAWFFLWCHGSYRLLN